MTTEQLVSGEREGSVQHESVESESNAACTARKCGMRARRGCTEPQTFCNGWEGFRVPAQTTHKHNWQHLKRVVKDGSLEHPNASGGLRLSMNDLHPSNPRSAIRESTPTQDPRSATHDSCALTGGACSLMQSKLRTKQHRPPPSRPLLRPSPTVAWAHCHAALPRTAASPKCSLIHSLTFKITYTALPMPVRPYDTGLMIGSDDTSCSMWSTPSRHQPSAMQVPSA